MDSLPAKTADSIDSRMAQLLVRGLDDEIVSRLKVRAAENGRSAEEEHRQILKAALLGADRPVLVDVLLEMPDAGEDSDFERPPEFGREIEL